MKNTNTQLIWSSELLIESSQKKSDDDEVCFVLDQHTSLDFYSASSLKQQSTDKHVVQLGQNILLLSGLLFQ
jgi:hypothetical protein